MDNALAGETPGAGEYGTADGDRAFPGKLTKRAVPGPLLDGSGNTLGQEKPPWNHVPIPGVHNDVDVLIEKVAFDDAQVHKVAERAMIGASWRRLTDGALAASPRP